MDIYRDIYEDLQKWKMTSDRRPLIIHGARQIGKTWVMRRFGAENYEHTAYFNFESSPELKSEFARTKDPKRIIQHLCLYTDQPVTEKDTLIIFDEIQECPDALNSLKYFCEDAPGYHIMAAGSLLGVAIHHDKGFPVGKVDFLRMYPLTFKEFLRAAQPDICDFLDNLVSIGPLPEIVTGKVWEFFLQYQVCGGMPRAAVASLEGRGIGEVDRIQGDILGSYHFDFSKHTSSADFPRIVAVWQSLPSQLAKENRKFIYKVVKPGARAREYESAIIWLREAGLVYQIFCVSKPGLPISAFDDLSAFKLYLLDIGLLRKLANLPPEIFVSDNRMFAEFKGALTENLIAQSLIARMPANPRYWTSEGTAEVDFLIQAGLDIIPVEVKSSTNTASKSLAVYVKKYLPDIAVVFSGKDLSAGTGKDSSTQVVNIPLPLADWLDKILSLLND